MPINPASVNASSYLDEDNEDTSPKIGTTVQSGWDMADEAMPSKNSDYPVDFRFASEPTLVKFLDGPYYYKQHWLDGRTKGRKSFVCMGEGCPLCDVLGDEPKNKAVFNVFVLSGENQGVQILTAVPTLFRLIKKAHEDDRKGPISREYWAISRTGKGPDTLYSLDYVRSRDLDEEWGIDPDDTRALVAAATPWSVEKIIRQEKRSELQDIARSLID